MIRDNQRLLNNIQIALDAVILFVSVVAAYYLRFSFYEGEGFLPLGVYITSMVFIIPVHLFVYGVSSLYEAQRNRRFYREATGVLKANIVTYFFIFVMFFLFKMIDVSRLVLFFAFCINALLSVTERYGLRKTLWYLREKGYNQKNVLLVGAGEMARTYLMKVESNKEYGYHIGGYIAKEEESFFFQKNLARLGDLSALESVLANDPVDEVIVALEYEEYPSIGRIVETCEKSGTKVSIIPFYIRYLPVRPYVDEMDGLPLINIRKIPLDNIGNAFIKRATDIFGSLFAILLLSPLLLFTAVMVKCTSEGPVIFKQERLGLGKRPFTMYKFRSMRLAREKEAETEWSRADNPRRTKFGAFIRKTSIDELPQLFNVLRGDMSLVGPRPERPFFAEQFKETVPMYMIKHQVRPGITGWAQVNGWRGDTSIEERIKCDIYYIENWNLLLDIRILAATLVKGLVNDEELA